MGTTLARLSKATFEALTLLLVASLRRAVGGVGKNLSYGKADWAPRSGTPKEFSKVFAITYFSV